MKKIGCFGAVRGLLFIPVGVIFALAKKVKSRRTSMTFAILLCVFYGILVLLGM